MAFFLSWDRRPALNWVPVFLMLGQLAFASPTQAKTPMPSYHKEILENGLVVLVQRREGLPAAAVQALVRAGGATETGRFTGMGISHVFEHMLFKGTPSRGVGEIERELRRYGGDIQAYTSLDYTGYHITIPVDGLPTAISILADGLQNPSFNQAELAKELQVILKEINMNEDSPVRSLYRQLWHTAYLEHPYRHPVIGYPKQVEAISRDDLVAYHSKLYVPNNMVLSIVGEVDPEETVELVRESFGDWKRGPSPDDPVRPEPPQTAPRELVLARQLELAYGAFAFHTVSLRHPDLFPLDVLALGLGNGRSSRLYRRLRAEENLVYSIDASSYTPRDPGLFTISFSAEPKNLDRIREIVFEELRRVQKEGFKEKELEKAKKQVISEHLFRLETLQAQAQDLAQGELLMSDPGFFTHYVDSIQKVDSGQVRSVANQYLQPESVTYVCLLPKAELLSQEAATGEKPTLQEPLFSTLTNGARAIVIPNTDLAVASVCVVFPGGVRIEEDSTNGWSGLLATMLKQGTRKHTDEELAEEVEGRGARLDTFSGNNSLGLTGSFMLEDLEQGLDWIAELLTDCVFPADKLQQQKESALAALRAENDKIFTVGKNELRGRLFEVHPYRLNPLGSERAIQALTDQDLRNWYRDFLRMDQAVIAVTGGVDPRQTLDLLEEKIGRIKRPAPKNDAPAIRQEAALEETVSTSIPMDKAQSLLLIGFRGVSVDSPDRIPFELLTQVLSGLGSRLFEKVREDLGLAYAVGAFPVVGVDPGYYVFYVLTTEEHIDAAREKLWIEINALKKEPISGEELESAKKYLEAQHLISQQASGALAFEVSLDELYGLGHKRYLEYGELLGQVNARQIQELAKKYFLEGAHVEVVLSPAAQEKESK